MENSCMRSIYKLQYMEQETSNYAMARYVPVMNNMCDDSDNSGVRFEVLMAVRMIWVLPMSLHRRTTFSLLWCG
jgi:hypothetical protein